VTRYRKKPIEIDAIQFTGTGDSCAEVTEFPGGPRADHTHLWNSTTNTGGIIKTLEGDMAFRPGDWIIKGVAGEFYPCKPEIFEATYEMEAGVPGCNWHEGGRDDRDRI